MAKFSAKQIKQVETLAEYGLTQQQIAHALGYAKRTTEKIIAEDERAKAAYKSGRARGINAIAKTVYRKAMEGNVACAFFYLKTQAGWRETERHELTGPDGGPIEHAIDFEALRAEVLGRVDRLATRLGTATVVGETRPNGGQSGRARL